MPAAMPSFDTESKVSMCRPVVSGLTPPMMAAKWILRAPRSSASKYTPVPSGDQRMLIGSRSKSALILRMSAEPPVIGTTYMSLTVCEWPVGA